MPIMNLLPQADTFISQSLPRHNYCQYAYMAAGVYPDGLRREALLGFKLRDVLPIGTALVGAWLQLSIGDMSAIEPTPEFSLLRITSRWSASQVTWNNCPAYDTTPVTTFVPPRCGLLSLNLTALTQQWLSGEKVNLGLSIAGRRPLCPGTFFRAATINAPDSDQWPRLKLLYESSVSVRFVNIERNLTAAVGQTVADVQDISLLWMVTVTVANLGPDLVTAHLEISADGTNYTPGGSILTVANGETVNLVPDVFAKYLKIVVVDGGVDGATVNVHYQGQIN